MPKRRDEPRKPIWRRLVVAGVMLAVGVAVGSAGAELVGGLIMLGAIFFAVVYGFELHEWERQLRDARRAERQARKTQHRKQ